MNLKEIKDLIDMLAEKDIAEFELERGNERIRIRRGSTADGAPQFAFTSVSPALPMQSPVISAPGAPAPAIAGTPSPTIQQLEELHIIKSPIVGTFYDAASPGAAPFVQIGDTVEAGQVLCIIEAMKLMNEIESDAAGVVEKRFVSNQQPVEYGEALFGLKKK